jgi:hypothetical protein
MTEAASYAKALYAVVGSTKLDNKKILANFNNALLRRGHQKLLPAILSEYEKLELADARAKTRSTITPESERSRVLLELYRRLIAAN